VSTKLYQPKLLFETADYLVADKPPGWLTISAPRLKTPAPVLKDWIETTDSARIWVVHRLDLETSGVVVFARSEAAHRWACIQFEKRKVSKIYHAWTTGSKPRFPVLRLHRPIAGKAALTQASLLETRRVGTLDYHFWEVRLETGRRHQIRIHLSQAGYPIVGDGTYDGHQGPRLLLHASKVELPLPTGTDLLSVESPRPLDFHPLEEGIS
jgi:23S rRNA-/tRNA-specific pseudouridylate synthase